MSDDSSALDRHAARAFQRVYKRLEELLELAGRHAELPEHTRRTSLQTDKPGNLRKINDAAGDVVEALEVARVTERRTRYREVEAALQTLRTQLDEYRRAQATAPDSSVIKSLLATTRGAYQKKIATAQRRVDALQTERGQIVEEIVTELRAIGLKVGPEQVKFFLVSVTGENLLDLGATFHNARQIIAQLAALNRAAGEDPVTCRRYYGLYMVMVRVLVCAYDRFLSDIDTDYLPALGEIEARNRAARAATEALLQQTANTTPETRRTLEGNLRAQELTERAAVLYLTSVREQRERLARSREHLEQRYAVVENTWRTASVAADLVTLMAASGEELGTLQEMELPELLPFENAEVQQRIAEMTRRIRDKT